MFQDRLRAARSAAGLSQKALAEKLFISQQAYAKYETGASSPNPDTMRNIAYYLNTTTDYLTGNDEYQDTSNPKKGIKIPVLGRVAAGIPIEAIEDVLDFEEITPEMAAKGEHFALQLNGDSMEPRMKDGDVVIVRKQSDVDSGQIAIVLVNGDDATCKKFVKHENGISLVSLNPAYSPMFYTFGEIEKIPITILGRVVELRAKF